MKYLFYLKDGFPKKFPLEKEISLVGRGQDCDLTLTENFVSSRHALVKRRGDTIEVCDLGSKNGTWKDHFRVETAKLKRNESFCIGHLEFYLREGNTDEFKLSKEVGSVINKISKIKTNMEKETHLGLNIFERTLLYTLDQGLRLNDISDLFEKTQAPLQNILKKGSLFLVEREEENIRIITKMTTDNRRNIDIQELLQMKNIWERVVEEQGINGGEKLYAYPVNSGGNILSLLYLVGPQVPVSAKVKRFLRDFSHEIGLINRLMHNDKRTFAGVESDQGAPQIITQSKSIINLMEKSRRIAKSSVSVLICGDTGTGKELFARFIHHYSGRDKEKYIGINCSAIPENLLEDELFGHKKGAFTGAISPRQGKLELASAGTLVLDEIGDMPLNLQAKLLRVLQEKEFYPLGGNTPVRIDLRIISMTNKNIETMIETSQFREDLLYRIADFSIEILPLRKRPEDIVPLLNHYINLYSRQAGKEVKGITEKALHWLRNYSWPGNVRQLENLVRIIISIINPGETIDLQLLMDEGVLLKRERQNKTGNRQEKVEILRILERNHWNKSKAASELGISRTALYKKMKKLNISY